MNMLNLPDGHKNGIVEIQIIQILRAVVINIEAKTGKVTTAWD